MMEDETTRKKKNIAQLFARTNFEEVVSSSVYIRLLHTIFILHIFVTYQEEFFF